MQCYATMKRYKVLYRADADTYFNELGEFIAEQTTPDFAIRYLQRLRNEIESLEFLAEVLPPSRYMMPLHYHPEAKTMPVGKRKLTVIFHIEGDYVIVDKILPSAMVMY